GGGVKSLYAEHRFQHTRTIHELGVEVHLTLIVRGTLVQVDGRGALVKREVEGRGRLVQRCLRRCVCEGRRPTGKRQDRYQPPKLPYGGEQRAHRRFLLTHDAPPPARRDTSVDNPRVA